VATFTHASYQDRLTEFSTISSPYGRYTKKDNKKITFEHKLFILDQINKEHICAKSILTKIVNLF
jgi:hypothetical protein